MTDIPSTNGDQQSKSGFQCFDKAATDVVLAAEFNVAGTRFATASADHRLRIYNVNGQGGTSIVDQWRAHDAEILDVHWLPAPFDASLATIASDNKFKIWREEPSQAYSSGRRFKCVFSQSPFSGVPYASFEILARTSNGDVDIYLALLSQDGLLSLLEPAEPDSLSAWRETDQFYPFGKYPRGQEQVLDLSFYQSVAPSSEAVLAGLDANALSLAVSAGSNVKILQAVKIREDQPYRFQEMLNIRIQDSGSGGTSTNINSIAWAPGPMRPFDVIAAACDDSSARVFDLHASSSSSTVTAQQPPANNSQSALSRQSTHVSKGSKSQRRPSNLSGGTPSGIGAGLAEMSKIVAIDRTEGAISISYDYHQSATLWHGHHVPVRKVKWSHDGSVLLSTGDDGKVHLWKQGIEGDYFEYSETGPV